MVQHTTREKGQKYLTIFFSLQIIFYYEKTYLDMWLLIQITKINIILLIALFIHIRVAQIFNLALNLDSWRQKF